ncbi:serine/threonine protein kinase [Ignicoccus islandicus DSM 13165]|uniref:non-specific serine/threonine protein kinase n=1 Tax=Ignicoccus islandicus DSM 13165 TaxID=940295 RepID=A0A0U2M9G1_9CREN|nr:KEOPS complex kinase/ATPase Bud32 [Ignicoccus islandicus]ALU11645.1 serine/threonine protein kinase [Ignicoccus islandicus DSM 13165]
MFLLARGSEADIYLIRYHGCKAVMKIRRRKRYRHSTIDQRIIEERTRNEVLNMIKAYENGLNVPLVLDFNIDQGKIVMEFIEGIPLTERLNKESIRMAGELLARLHLLDIAHWDFTTLNILYTTGDKIYAIDFSLSRHTRDPREKAVDAHLIIRSLRSIHKDVEGKLIDAFWEGYSKYGDAKLIQELVEEIESMGRYVKSRRKTVW